MTNSINNPPSDRIWAEPESAASVEHPPKYPYNNITQTESGHTFEMDDTPSRERVRLQHRSGTFIEMHPNGDEVHKVYGNGFEITIKNKNVLIEGVCNIEVKGDCNMHVGGDLNQVVDGNYNLTVAKEYRARIGGEAKIDADDDISISAGKDYSGSVNLNAPQKVYVNADLFVDGTAAADMVIAETRVDAGTGMSAGLFGVVSKGPVSSATSMQSPVGTWGFSGSILMTDLVNLVAHNFHTHPAPDGSTGIPTIPFV